MSSFIYHLKTNFAVLCVFSTSLFIANLSSANEPPIVIEEGVQLITKQEIQQGLVEMQKKMNTRIEQWGSKLTREDFDRKRGKLVLKSSKQLEVCGIFQGVIDETYQSAQRNKHRLTEDDQKVVENRTAFVQALGIQNNIIPTILGFDCRVR